MNVCYVLIIQVSDGALRCFASLADRFIRRGVDPAPLALNGLTQELLQRLATAGCSAVAGAATSSPGKPSILHCCYYYFCKSLF